MDLNTRCKQPAMFFRLPLSFEFVYRKKQILRGKIRKLPENLK